MLRALSMSNFQQYFAMHALGMTRNVKMILAPIAFFLVKPY